MNFFIQEEVVAGNIEKIPRILNSGNESIWIMRKYLINCVTKKQEISVSCRK